LSLKFCKRKQKARSSAQSGRTGHPDQGEGLAYKKEEENGLLACEYSVLFSRDPDETANFFPGHTKSLESKRGGGISPVPHSLNLARFGKKSSWIKAKETLIFLLRIFVSESRRREAARYRGGWATPTKAKASFTKRRKKMGYWPVSIRFFLVVTRTKLLISIRVTLNY
jgi:hypothetical protein